MTSSALPSKLLLATLEPGREDLRGDVRIVFRVGLSAGKELLIADLDEVRKLVSNL